MTDDEWLAGASALASAQSSTKAFDFETVRAALALTYALMRDAPAKPDDLYSGLAEADLRLAAHDHYAALELGDWSWALAAKDIGETVLSIGGRVRALDRLLRDIARHSGPPVDPDEDYYCAHSNYYVIPRLTARVARAGYGGRATFERRGTLDHRLLPRTIDSYTISLTWLADIAETSADDRLGAAMFQNFDMRFRIEDCPKRFIAETIDCDSAVDTIRAAVSEAHRTGCVALAWPELTMRPEVELAALSEALADLALSDSRGGSPAYTLAGSWHVEGAKGRENAAPVLDACGRVLLTHAKSRPYADDDYGIEDIERSYKIPILVTQEQLVAFGICKDFCDLRKGIPYPTLNVDLVMVGSIGTEPTMTGHRNAAGDASIYGCRTFVVQQDLKTDDKETGWVLPPAASPISDATSTLRSPSWSTHRAFPKTADKKKMDE